ncbi:MAG: HEAT repeat domain-containing protein [Ignavibacteriales bacterium]|nr:HEAT repeat domain-containing protein [Ignavibacteriales bacterium]
MRSKFLSFILFAVFFAAILTPAVNANNAPKKSLSYRQAELNYINGVESDNAGLRLSSTLFLGEMKSDEAVIPLMRVLKSCDDEACRIAAALSLTKIGDSRGIYAVKKPLFMMRAHGFVTSAGSSTCPQLKKVRYDSDFKEPQS